MNNEIFKIVGSVLLEDEAFINGIKKVLDEAENSTNKLAEKFDKAGKKISDIGGKMTIGLTAPITAIATMGVNYNMEMESLESNLSVLLGSSEKATAKLEELRTMGARTPFETTDLVKATQKMLSFGLESDKTNGYLQMLGDIAMGDANKLDSLTLAFSQIGASGRASMEDINQMIDQGFNPLTYIAKQTGESMAEVRDRVSEGKVSFEEIAGAMQTATSEGGAFHGSMDTASQTTAGRISTLKDNFGVMVGTLTESVMPTFEKIVDKLAEWVEWFSNLDAGTQEIIIKSLLLIATLGPFLTIVGKIISSVGSAITIFTKFKTIITGSTTAMKLLGPAITFITGPVGIAVAVITGLIAIFVLLWNNCDGFRNFWLKLWDTIKEKASSGYNSIKTTFNNIKTAITGPIKEAKEKVVGWINDIKSGLSSFTTKIKLPHFTIKNASLNPKDWIQNGLPKLYVDWYAKGGIFDEPTIFSTPYGLKGVGEAGPEAVTPISKLQDYIKIANNESDSGIVDKLDMLIEILLSYLPSLTQNRQLVLDNGVLVGEIIGDIDELLAKRQARKRRG